MPWSQDWLIAAGAYPGFCSMKQLEIFIHLVGEGHRKSSVLPKNTTQCPRPGLEPGPFAPGTSALTIRPPRLPQKIN